jgi:hypothetical protein
MIRPVNRLVFTVPHAVDLLGETFELLGLRPLMAASAWRLRLACRTGEGGESRLAVPGEEAGSERVVANLDVALRAALPFPPPGPLWMAAVNDAALPADWSAAIEHSPAFAVAAVTAAATLAGRVEALSGSDIATAAARFLRLRQGLPPACPRHEAACAVCVQGGLSLIGPDQSGESLAEVVPAEGLLLAAAAHPTPVPVGEPTRRLLALRASRDDAEAARSLESVFDADAEATEHERVLQYAGLRVREMLETLAAALERRAMDNDVLGEMIDDAAEFWTDYLGFEPGPLAEARQVARGEGALGSRYVFFSGALPAVVVLAPERHADVRPALEKAGFTVLPLTVASNGLTPES